MAISAAEFNIEEVIFCDPETDSFGNINVPIKYERNGKQGPVTFDLPIVRTDSYGVISQVQQGGSTTHSIKIIFPRKKPIFVEDRDKETGEVIGGHYEEPSTIMVPSNPDDPNSPKVEKSNDYEEAQQYLDIINLIYQKAVDHCFANKMKLGFGSNTRQKIMVEAQLKNPVYRRMLPDSEDIEDPNYPPSIYFRFIESGPKGNPPNTVYTRFTGVDQKPINWRALENTMMYLVPTVRIERIFLGAKKNIQCKITSAIVLQTKALEEISKDNMRLQELVNNNPTLLQAFLKSLGNLEKYRKVKREADFESPAKEKLDIKAQQLPENIPRQTSGDEDDEIEQEVFTTKESSPSAHLNKVTEGESLLENFMKQQQTPSAKRITVSKGPLTNKS